MGFISLLPEYIFNKIAAGEVIQRPSSVVKELVENSLDAGASHIGISIEKAGMKSISIHDNGFGMDADDAILCFEAHATSKIKSEKDILSISTMGFRGEAMPSIASVSKVRLKTRRPESLEGTQVIINGGKFILQEPAGCAYGTEITVSELFYNLPARKKFLKGESTEEKHIFETVLLLALANPAIAFDFRADGKNIFSSPGSNDLLQRISLLLGKETADNSISVFLEKDTYKIRGYISKPCLTRNTRREQRFFVNKRPIRSLSLSSAVKEAYGSRIMHGAYPVVTMFIDLPYNDVDVNVHPAKHEVRFKHEVMVANLVIEAVRDVLNSSIAPVSGVSISSMPISSVLESSSLRYSVSEKTQPVLSGEIKLNPDILPVKVSNFTDRTPAISQQPNREEGLTLPGCGYLKIIEILNKTYILALSDIGLVVIDQHAAHERIIFERLLKDYSGGKMRQDLLIPITVNLTRSELQVLNKYLDSFDRIGFGIDLFGEGTVLVHSIPSAIKSNNISSLLSNMLNSLTEQNVSGIKIDAATVAKTACSLAVKANDELSIEEAAKLISDLSKCDLPFNCPHGRPTVINISLKELEKRFGRIS